MCDIETAESISIAQINDSLMVFLDYIEQNINVKPIVYSSHNFLKTELIDSNFAKFPLWVASYRENPPTDCKPWPKWNIWQFTAKGSEDVINSDVDEDVSAGTKADWNKLLVPQKK